MGRDTVKIEACRTEISWEMASNFYSSNITIRWADLPSFG
ncbi:DUF4113 domain-containing protein [Oligoflexus sp.]